MICEATNTDQFITGLFFVGLAIYTILAVKAARRRRERIDALRDEQRRTS